MKTTHQLMAPIIHVTDGPEGSTRLSMTEGAVTVMTILERGAARAAWRGMSRVLRETDTPDGDWSLKELARLAGCLKDSKADLTEYRADMLAVIDSFMELIEANMRREFDG